jgi:hypothetical protein
VDGCQGQGMLEKKFFRKPRFILGYSADYDYDDDIFTRMQQAGGLYMLKCDIYIFNGTALRPIYIYMDRMEASIYFL